VIGPHPGGPDSLGLPYLPDCTESRVQGLGIVLSLEFRVTAVSQV